MIISGVVILGNDAEVRFTQSGMAVANLSVAYNFGKKDEQFNRQSQWLDLSLWGKLAEALAPYLKKGSKVSITADEPHIEHYTKRDGTQQSKIVANIINIELMGDKRTNDQQEEKPGPRQPVLVTGDNEAPYNDDIPF